MIFLSYSWANRDSIRYLETELQARRVQYWVDHEQLDLARPLCMQILRAIASCDVLVHVASTASHASAWVRLELFWAKKLGKGVFALPADSLKTFPANVEACPLSLVEFLTSAPSRSHAAEMALGGSAACAGLCLTLGNIDIIQ